MVGLPKWIIKKYGVTKKAWQVFKGNGKKRASKPKRSYRTKVTHMARRRSRKKSRKKAGYNIYSGARKFLAGVALGASAGPVLGTFGSMGLKLGVEGAAGSIVAPHAVKGLAMVGAQANAMLSGFLGGVSGGSNDSSAAW